MASLKAGEGGMIENLEVMKEKVMKFLGFANITREDIENLFKVAVSNDCELLGIFNSKILKVYRFTDR